MRIKAATIVLFLFTVAACDSDPEPTTDTGTPDVALDTGAPDSGVQDSTSEDSSGPVCEVEPTLSSLQEKYFNTSCSFSSCHGATVNPAGGLDLRDGVSYDALIDKSALFAPTKMLVVAGDPDNSFLVQKVDFISVRSDLRLLLPALVGQADFDLLELSY